MSQTEPKGSIRRHRVQAMHKNESLLRHAFPLRPKGPGRTSFKFGRLRLGFLKL